MFPIDFVANLHRCISWKSEPWWYRCSSSIQWAWIAAAKTWIISVSFWMGWAITLDQIVKIGQNQNVRILILQRNIVFNPPFEQRVASWTFEIFSIGKSSAKNATWIQFMNSSGRESKETSVWLLSKCRISLSILIIRCHCFACFSRFMDVLTSQCISFIFRESIRASKYLFPAFVRFVTFSVCLDCTFTRTCSVRQFSTFLWNSFVHNVTTYVFIDPSFDHEITESSVSQSTRPITRWETFILSAGERLTSNFRRSEILFYLIDSFTQVSGP